MSSVCYFDKEKTGYFEGPLEDKEKYHPDGIVVEKCPGRDCEFNWTTMKWEKTSASLKRYYEPRKMLDIRKSEIYKYDAALTDQQKQERDSYISALWSLDYSKPGEFSYPTCPDFMKE